MKQVGEALQGATNAYIGITSWGIVTNNGDLLEELPYKPLGGKFSYQIASSLVEKGTFLDHHHTHFLLVDNGTCRRFGCEIDFRSKFEKYIMKGAQG